MSQNLSVETVIEKNKLHSDTPFLVCLDVDIWDENLGQVIETLHLVRNSEDILYQGKIYTAVEFDVKVKNEVGEMPSVTVNVVDYKRVIQRELQEYGGGIGFPITMMIINAGNLDQKPEHVEYFRITGTGAKNYMVSWTLGTENPLTGRCPKRIAWRDRCSWRYKGQECGYSGPLQSCDLSLQGENGCAAHSNTPRYGGFPGIKPGSANFG